MTRETVARIINAASIDDFLRIKELVKELTDNSEPGINPSQLLNEENDYGQTALNVAAQNGHFNIVQYLIEEVGVNASQENLYGQTALNRAVRNGHLNIVKYLIYQNINLYSH